MQNLANYSLVHNGASAEDARRILAECAQRVDHWLQSKGRIAAGQLVLSLGGRSADLTTASYESDLGVSREWELTEPLIDYPDAEFRTTLQLAEKNCGVYLYLNLKAGYKNTTIAPELHLPVKPPRILFELARVPGTAWHFRTMPVGLKSLTFDASHADKVIEWLSHPERPMPIVVLSEYEGEILHPDSRWQDKVTERLFGMALVIRFSSELSWALTDRVKKIWSCYHGAVRIYWPNLRFEGDPFRHDLMIAEDIMERFNTDDRRVAADCLLDHLFERFRRISGFSVRCPTVFPELRRAASQERITELRKQVSSKRDATKATANLASENKQLREQLFASESLVSELTTQLDKVAAELTRVQNDFDIYRHQNALTPNDSKSPAIQTKEQLTSIDEAINRARSEFAEELIFGDDVDNEATRLKPDAGPPSRVFNHLAKLAEASRLLRSAIVNSGSASLGKPICEWLSESGVTASGEHQETMKGRGKSERTWDFGDGTDHVFENHTKPNDAKSPNQCVRIYFEWCNDRRKIVIGSVGRKPGL